MTSDTVLGIAEASSGPAMAKEWKGCLDLVEVVKHLAWVKLSWYACVCSRSPQLSWRWAFKDSTTWCDSL